MSKFATRALVAAAALVVVAAVAVFIGGDLETVASVFGQISTILTEMQQ